MPETRENLLGLVNSCIYFFIITRQTRGRGADDGRGGGGGGFEIHCVRQNLVKVFFLNKGLVNIQNIRNAQN